MVGDFIILRHGTDLVRGVTDYAVMDSLSDDWKKAGHDANPPSKSRLRTILSHMVELVASSTTDLARWVAVPKLLRIHR